MMTGAVGSKQLLGSGGRDCGKANGKQHAERGKLGMTGQTAVDGKGPKQGELERRIRALVHLTQAPQDPPTPPDQRPPTPHPRTTHTPNQQTQPGRERAAAQQSRDRQRKSRATRAAKQA